MVIAETLNSIRYKVLLGNLSGASSKMNAGTGA